MSTGERSAGRPPMYARLLRLRRIRITGLVSFLLMECTVAVAVLLALAELVSWWAVPLLPVLVAAVVKINDMVGAPGKQPTADRFEPTEQRLESWGDELAADERHADEWHADERYAHDQYGHDGQPAWAGEQQASHQASPQDWYADNPTQEIVLPTALTGRPRQRSGDQCGEPEAYGAQDAEPAYAGAGRAAYSDRNDAEPAYSDHSYAEPAYSDHSYAYAYADSTAYAEPTQAGQGHQGDDAWGRHAASASTVEDTYAGQPAGTPAGNRSRDAAALAAAGDHVGARTGPGQRTGRGTPSDRGAAGRAGDGWTTSRDVEGADFRTPSRNVDDSGGRTASRGVDDAGGRTAAAGGATRPADYWTRAADTDAARTTGAGRGGVTGTGQAQAPGGGLPPGVPGSAAPRRAQLFGAAVRRSMAAQAQQIGGAPSGRAGRSGTGNDTGSGRHARGESGGTTGRQMVRLNDRGFNRRLRDA